MERQEEKIHAENTSAKKKKLKKERGPLLEKEEEQTPLKKKQKKLRKERESSHEEEEETSAEEKTRVLETVERSSSKKQRKSHREISSEGKLEVIKDGEKKQKTKKKKQKESIIGGEGMPAKENPQSENSVPAERHAKTAHVSFRLLVPSKDIGKVIGKQGSHIQQLQEESGASINVGDSMMPENEVEDFAKIRLLVADSQAKVAFGKDGEMLDEIRDTTGAVINVYRKDRFPLLALASQTDKLLQLDGKASQVQEALKLVATRLREILRQPGDVKRSRRRPQRGPFETTVEIKVPNELIGKLIGKGGSTIRRIREQCRVYIKVDEDVEDGAKERILHMKGKLPQVTMAQTLLRCVLGSKRRVK